MDLHETFEFINKETLVEFVDLGQEENLLLDFKLVNKAELTHSDDKKNLAKAISGFANSSGGLVIWGVDARKNENGIDCACRLIEIDPLPLFISRLNELTGLAVSPIVNGVKHKPVQTSPNKGFAVTLIPESDSGPHMAKLGEDRYYKRSGASFYRMEHFDIADMFGRRQRPSLFPIIEFRSCTVDDPHEEVHFGFINKGKGIAKHVGFFCHFDDTVDIIGVTNPHHLSDVTKLNQGHPTVSYSNPLNVMHPNGIIQNVGYVTIFREDKTKRLKLSISWYCENMRSLSETIELVPNEGRSSF